MMTTMIRKDIPALDCLSDSPIISPTSPSGGSLINILPASALAERIFNDPDAWRVHGDESDPQPELPLDETEMLEQLIWLDKELRSLGMLAPPAATGDYKNEVIMVGSDTSLPNCAPPQVNGPAIGDREPSLLDQGQRDTHTVTPKFAKTPAFPAYVHDPPGSLAAPSNAFFESLSGLEVGKFIRPISLAHLFNRNLPPDQFSAELSIEFTNILEGVADHEEVTYDLSPPISEASTSSTASSSGTSHPMSKSRPPPPPFSQLNVPELSSSGLPAPPLSAATSILSPFKVNSASATLSFLEWYGISAESPLFRTLVAGNDQISVDTSAPASAIFDRHSPPQSPSLTTIVVPSDTENTQNNITHDEPKMVDISVVGDYENPPVEDNNQFGGVAKHDHSPDPSSPIGQSPPATKPSLLKTSKRNGAIYDSPIKIRSGSPNLHRKYLKPPPAIPIPDVPANPPPVPPKDIPHGLPKVTSPRNHRVNPKGKTALRRLPSIPKKARLAIQKSGFESSSVPQLSVNCNLPPAPRQASALLPKSVSESPMQTPKTGIRTTCTYTPLSPHSSLITARTPLGPAGPRKRGAGNIATPTKSPQWARGLTSRSSIPSITATTDAQTNSPLVSESPATVSRSISEPKGLLRHNYSQSQ